MTPRKYFVTKKFGDIGTGSILAKIVKLRRFLGDFGKFCDIGPAISLPLVIGSGRRFSEQIYLEIDFFI
jgi:hypothetical protein